MVTEEEADYLKTLYYNVNKTGSLRGPAPLYRLIKREGVMKISMNKIREWLKSQPVYTRFKQIGEVGVKKQPRNKIKAQYVGHMFQWDLMVIDPEYGKKERTVEEIQKSPKAYILVGVDVFSRFLFCANLNGRDSDAVIDGLKLIFDSYDYSPEMAMGDPAGEHRSAKTRQFFKSRGIHLYYSNSLKHAPSAERMIRVIRTGLRRYGAATNSSDYITPLPGIVKSHNESVCRATKERPVDVFTSKKAAWRAYQFIYLRKQGAKREARKPSKNLIPKIGQYVRISRIRGAFEKESSARGTFSQEIFKVAKIVSHMERPMIHVEDLKGKQVKGGFYPEEVQVVDYSPDNLFEIEKVLGRKSVNGVAYVKVKWSGYTGSEWIEAAKLTHVDFDVLNPALH